MAGTPSSNGVLHGPLAAANRPRARRPVWIWPVLLLALLGLNAAIVGVTIYFAVSDTSVATEPDYYAKALKFDQTIQLRHKSMQLGWTAHPSVSWSEPGGASICTVRLADRDGQPLTDARVTVVAFAGVRSDVRQTIVLDPSPTPGEYLAPIRVDHAGLWHFRVSAARNGDEFFHETDVMVPAHDSPTR